MSGWATMIADCLVCRQPFAFNPLLVPSWRGEPVCRDCMDSLNKLRGRKGLPAFQILPAAYEPVEADAL